MVSDAPHPPGPGSIGFELREARERRGWTLHELEERTKIRRRYLEALEQERWSALPSPAHAKAFLRAIATELELDGEALADSFRRRAEPASATPEHRGRLRAPALAAAAALTGAGILAVAVVGGEDERRPAAERAGRAGADGRERARHERRRAPRGPFALTVEPREPVELCLVGGGRRPLVDSQRLAAGTVEGPFRGREFRLDLLSGGTVRISVGGEVQRLRSREPARYEVTAAGAEPQSVRRMSCP